MKGTLKRVVSILLAVALVVTSLQYTPKTVSAADYTGLTYMDVAGTTFSIACESVENSAVIDYVNNEANASLFVATKAVAGLLPDYQSITINGVTNNAPNAGAWFRVYVTELTYTYNVITIIDAVGSKCVFVIKNSAVTDGSVGPEEIQTEAPTEFVEGMELFKDAQMDPADVDAWQYNGLQNVSYNNDKSVSFTVPEITGGNNHDSQFKQTNIALEANKWYKVTYTVTSSVDKRFQLMVQGDGSWTVHKEIFTDVKAGETVTVETVFTGVSDSKVLVGVMMGYVQGTPSAAANVTIKDFSITAYTGEPETTAPEETTTLQPNYERDAFANVEAEAWDVAGGGSQDTNASLSGGGNLGGVTNGIMPGYNLYFSEPAGSVEFFYTSPNGTGGNVEIYVDDTTGSPVATITLENTGGADWSAEYYELITADVTIPAGNHTIYTKYVVPAGSGVYYVANVDYFKFGKASENLTWLTNDNLTAGAGEGAKYATIGAFPYNSGSHSFTGTGINITTGAYGRDLVVKLNGEQKASSANYAVGMEIPYTDLVSGENVIEITGTYSVNDVEEDVNILIYIQVPVKTTNLYINDYSAYTGKYIIKFDELEDATSYKVYIDGVDSGLTVGGSGDYLTYDELVNYSVGNHTVQLTAVYEDGTETAKSASVSINKPETPGNNNDIAQIYVQTDDKSIQALGITKAMDNLQSSITVIDQNGEFDDIYEDVKKTTIKVRGNSTAQAEKKAFNIKFDTKYNVFGLGKAKKWSLLANAFDKSGIRNKLAMELGIDLGVPYNSQSRYIDLYLNGRYMGNYLLIESVEAGSTRVDIDSENTDEYNNDVLLELENSKRFEEGGINFSTKLYEQYFIFNSPETVEDSTQEFVDRKLANTIAMLNQFETDLSESDYAGFSQYIDVDSFVNYYLVCELFKYQDIAFSSTRFFIKDDVLYAGPMWDLDLSSGNVSIAYYGALDQGYTGYKASTMKWFEMLMANGTFAKLVKDRFEEVLPTIKAVYEGEGNLLDSVVEEIRASMSRNYTAYDQGGAGWSISQKDAGDGYSYANTHNFASWDETIDQFRTWITNRVAYLESQWIGLDGFTYTKGTSDGVLSDTKDGLNNYVRYENISASATSGDANQAIDNNAGTRWESAHGVDPQDYIVDLGAQYSLKEFLIRWEGANAKDFTIEISADGVDYKTVANVTDAASEGNRLDTITLDEATTGRFVKIHGTARNLTYGYSIWELGIYGPDAQKEYETIPEPTTPEETTPAETTPAVDVIAPVEEPADAEWIEVLGSNGEYYYYIPAEFANYFAAIENRMENIYFACKEIAAPFTSVTLNGTAIAKSDGGFVEVDKKLMEPGAYQLEMTDFYGTQTISFWIKKKKISNYTPTGLATSILDGILTVNWSTSEDADIEGCLYTVTVAGEATDVTDMASVKTATFDFTGKEYGNYEVVLTTKTVDGTVVDTQTLTVRYKDPDAIETTVTYRERWEAKRCLITSWTAVENATGYAVYVDGKLFDTTTELTYTIPAYAFANNLNEFNQPTTVGAHSISLVALFNGAEALENEKDVNSKHVMDTYTADVLVNYMYGNLTNIWNITGIDSVWNFTVSEIPKKDIVEGADVKVEYNDDGSADVNIIYTGRHSTYVDQSNVGDQAWTIKAAIYDQPIQKGELLNLAFDITGPAYLAGQRIQIKCVPEEVDENDKYYSVPDYGYEEALYTFEPVYAEDGETVEYAVLHYTNSFETTNDTYDLLFGLGLLHGAQEGDSIDINLSDPNVKKVYGVTSVTATGIPNVEDKTNNSGFISWTTDVPTHLSSEYTYDLVIKDKDGNIVSVNDADGNVLSTLDENGNVLVSVPNATNNSTYYGFAEGTYTVEVSSVYDNSITATKSTEMVIQIPQTNYPDLIITDITIPEGDYRVGDTVPVSITMTNIGTADATPAAGNLAVHLHVKSTTSGEKGWYTVDGNTIPVGGSATKTINYTITAGDSDGNDLFTIIAEADSDNSVAEGDETNNVHSVVYRFLPNLQEVTLTNDGTNVNATWPDAGEGTKYVIEYEVDGETKQVEVDTNSYVFPVEDVMENNAQVNVYIAGDDGSNALYAEGIALADLIIEKISTEKDVLYPNETTRFVATVKNIGTAKATSGDKEQINAVTFTIDGFSTYTLSSYVVSPNETADIVGDGYYTATAVGDITVTGLVDERNNINESNESNNTFTGTITVAEPLKEGVVELKNTDGTVSVTWEDPNVTDYGKTAEKYVITYVVDGETKTAEVGGDVTEYVFEEVLDNNTVVTVTGKYTDSEETVQVGTDIALADLIIESIVPENGFAYVGQANNLYITVKNIGTAGAKASEGNTQTIGVAFETTGVFTGNGWVDNVILEPDASAVITVQGYTPTDVGNKELTARVDDINRIPESDDTNNAATVDVYAVEEGAVKLSLDETGDTPVVKTSWELPDGVTADENSQYIIKYVVDGVTITDTIQNTAENTVVYYDEETGRCYTNLENNLDRDTQVYVYVVSGEETIPCGVDTAEVDLVISGVEIVSDAENDNTAYLNDKFNIVVSVKNQGTAKVEESSPDVNIGYGQWIITQLTEQANITVANSGLVSSNAGLLAGDTAEYTYTDVVASAVNTYQLSFKVDSPGFDNADVIANGFIRENNDEGTGETNNTYTSTLIVEDPPFVQEKMDWTLFTSQMKLEDGTPYVIVNNGSDKKPVEYKVLDTSITDLHYYDIYTKIEGYGGDFIGFTINGESPMVKSENRVVEGEEETKIESYVTTKMYFAQVSSHTTDIYDYETMDSTIQYGEPRVPGQGDGVLQTWDGNGYQLHTRSLAAGKYYIVKLVNDDGSYLVLGLRIPGDLGNWVLAKPSDNSDPNKVPVVYHDKNHTIDGAVYYDGSDLGLAGMSVYNGNHLALTTDGTMTLNSGNWKMTIAYAKYDENGDFVQGIPDDIKEELGYDYEYDPEPIDLLPTDEIFGEQGANTILIKMPELMWELPIHSELGGEWDSEYYILRVYPDTINRPDDYVYIPLNIRGNIPMIEDVNGLSVAGRGDTLSVMWTNTYTQDADGYLYDVYIDINDDGDYDDEGEKVSSDVVAGSYSYIDGLDVANASGYSVKVVGKWCQQTALAECEYIRGGDQEKETIPAETPTYPNDNNEHKWVLIDGQNVLPITSGDGITNAQVWYYTDDDMYSVVGYNGHYISLNGSTTYFTGEDSKIFVQDGPKDDTFESKIHHDNFYDGQILINAANMFTTYEDEDGDGVLYYTVKVVGENGNTSKDFYFKVVLSGYEDKTSATGEWRIISGQHTLPVMFGEYALQGTIEYFDYPTLTNTYNMTGYNDYFISVVGENNNYSGRTTKLYVSGPSEFEILGTEGDSTTFTEVAGNQTYSEKEIYDQVYRGQIQMRSSTTFEVKYKTTYYLLKIEGTAQEDGAATTTYVPVRVTVSTGDVEVQGFQMNTDNSETGIARYNPSLRVVSRASNVMTIGNVLHKVVNYGTVYALYEDVKDNYELMKIQNEEADDYNERIYHLQATKDVGTLHNWTSANGDEKYNKYYALSFEYEFYSFTSITTRFSFRAYAVLEDGTVVYGNNVYSTTMEEVAEHLYTNKKIGTKAGHEYLYNNVLNILAIQRNRPNIAKALMAATDVDEATDANYPLVNQTYKDMNNYAYCVYGYEYSGREEFVCSTEENEKALLAIIDPTNKYGSVANWIYNNVEKGKGFYEKVEYSWDNSIDKEFDTSVDRNSDSE